MNYDTIDNKQMAEFLENKVVLAVHRAYGVRGGVGALDGAVGIRICRILTGRE